MVVAVEDDRHHFRLVVRTDELGGGSRAAFDQPLLEHDDC